MRITLSLAPSLFTQHRTLRTEGERGKEQEENKANTHTHTLTHLFNLNVN